MLLGGGWQLDYATALLRSGSSDTAWSAVRDGALLDAQRRQAKRASDNARESRAQRASTPLQPTSKLDGSPVASANAATDDVTVADRTAVVTANDNSGTTALQSARASVQGGRSVPDAAHRDGVDVQINVQRQLSLTASEARVGCVSTVRDVAEADAKTTEIVELDTTTTVDTAGQSVTLVATRVVADSLGGAGAANRVRDPPYTLDADRHEVLFDY